MTLAEKIREYHRAARDRNDALTERLAVDLAPYFDEICEAMDRDPKAIVPQWGLLA